MASVISEIDLYTALRDKLGDTETRDLIAYVKTNREDVQTLKQERTGLATKDDLALFTNDIKQEITALRSDTRLNIADLRSDTKLDIANLRTDIEKGFKEQLRWVIVLLMGFASLIITVIKLL